MKSKFLATRVKTSDLLKASVAAIAVFAATTSADAAVAIDFGTMNTTGDNLTGWTVNGGGSTNTVNGPAEAGAKMFWMRTTSPGVMTGTSDGDVLAAGDYTISFILWEYTNPLNNGNIKVDVIAWDGTTETVLGTTTTTDNADFTAYPYTIPFTVATTDTDIIGDSIRVKFTGVAPSSANTYVGFDNITGEFSANSEPSAYDTWAGGAVFTDDDNGDGVTNGVAFLLGAVDPDEIATARLPTVTESGGGLIMTFNCLPTGARGSATLRVEHSSDLGISDPWLATIGVVPDADNPVLDNGVTFVVTPGPVGPPALNSVTATIDSAAAAGGKLFGRLDASQP